MFPLTEGLRIVRSVIRDRRFLLAAVAVLTVGGVLAGLLVRFVSLSHWVPPVGEGRRILYIDQRNQGMVIGLGHGTVTDLRGIDGIFDHLAIRSEDRGRSRSTGTRLLRGEIVSGNYFDVLGLSASIGRTLGAPDDSPGANRAVVISHRLWKELFDFSPTAVGQTIDLQTAATGLRASPSPTYEVVGVMPEAASSLATPFASIDYWVPVAVRAADYACDVDLYSDNWFFTAVGTLRAGVTLAQAESATTTAWRHSIDRRLPGRLPGRSLRISEAPSFALPLDRSRLGIERLSVLALGLAGLVVVTSLSNLSGLLMLRAVRRRRADATKYALGGGRWLATGTVCVEAAIIGTVTALAAPVAILMLTSALAAAMDVPSDVLDVLTGQSGNASSLGLGGACLIGSLLAAVVPAYHCRPRVIAEWAVGRADLPPRLGLGQALVIIPQVVTATVVMMLAATFGAAAAKVETVEPGYAVDELVVARYLLPGEPRCRQTIERARAATVEREAVEARLLGAMATLSGSRGALTSGPPFEPLTNWVVSDADDSSERVRIAESSVSTEYRDVLGLTQLRGRFLDGTETAGSELVVVISASLATRLWDGDPIGRRLAFSPPSSQDRPTRWLSVIGVVSDVRRPESRGEVQSWVYLPLSQRPGAAFAVWRVPGVSGSWIQRVSELVAQADSTLLVQDVLSMKSIVTARRYPQRLSAIIMSLCCVLTAWLACVGLYGQMAYSTFRRLREFGICAALGASKTRLIWMALREGLRYAAAGIVVGLGASLGALALVRHLIGDLPPLTIDTAVVLTGLVSAVLVIASVGPARQAATIHPATLLRDS